MSSRSVKATYKRMSHDERVALVDDLLRNRALMLDEQGRPMPGLGAFANLTPSDEEIRSRAVAIVDATGSNVKQAVVLIDAFGEEMGQRLEKWADDLKEVVLEQQGKDAEASSGSEHQDT